MAVLTAVLDANVLYSAPLRDLLVRLALAGLYRARWTEEIHDEWIQNVLKNRPDLAIERLARTRDLMNHHVLDSVVRDYEALIPMVQLPDEMDRHVVAAAIRADADIIVTFNLSDFPAATLTPLGIEARHPDAFIESLLRAETEAVCSTIRKQRLDLDRPPKSANDLLATFEELGLRRTVALLRPLQSML